MNNKYWKDIYNNFNNNLDNNKLYNYRLLEFQELKDIKKGSHIKYINNNKVFNGGFIIDVLYPNSFNLATFILKSNIIWKLRYGKYSIYIKENNNKKNLYNFLEIDIKKKRELIKEKYNL